MRFIRVEKPSGRYFGRPFLELCHVFQDRHKLSPAGSQELGNELAFKSSRCGIPVAFGKGSQLLIDREQVSGGILHHNAEGRQKPRCIIAVFPCALYGFVQTDDGRNGSPCIRSCQFEDHVHSGGFCIRGMHPLRKTINVVSGGHGTPGHGDKPRTDRCRDAGRFSDGAGHEAKKAKVACPLCQDRHGACAIGNAVYHAPGDRSLGRALLSYSAQLYFEIGIGFPFIQEPCFKAGTRCAVRALRLDHFPVSRSDQPDFLPLEVKLADKRLLPCIYGAGFVLGSVQLGKVDVRLNAYLFVLMVDAADRLVYRLSCQSKVA